MNDANLNSHDLWLLSIQFPKTVEDDDERKWQQEELRKLSKN
jgi:hypothetical protein